MRWRRHLGGAAIVVAAVTMATSCSSDPETTERVLNTNWVLRSAPQGDVLDVTVDVVGAHDGEVAVVEGGEVTSGPGSVASSSSQEPWSGSSASATATATATN